MGKHYHIYSDESKYNTGRYRSIATIEIEETELSTISDNIKEILRKNDIKEFAWKKTCGDGKYTKCALDLINFLLDEAITKNIIRIQVIIWDIYDSRHTIKGRDDKKNFQIMYFRILSHTIDIRENCDTFSLYPDEKDDTCWSEIENHLSKNKFFVVEGKNFNPETDNLADNFIIKDKIEKCSPSNSCQTPLIQCADLLAGLATFSYENYEKYNKWRIDEATSFLLPNLKKELDKYSKSEKTRFTILQKLLTNILIARKIRLDSKKGLSTFKNPQFNFWLYSPQGDYDKAPLKSSSTSQ